MPNINAHKEMKKEKKLSEEDLSGDRLELPDEIELIDTDSFVVRVRDQTYEHIQILTRLKKSLRSENGDDDDDQAVYLDDKWSKFVDERSIEEGDVIVFCVDFPRHVIIITVYRVDEEEDFQIPP
uniref:TF-B3 domain-containing protein n=1 Tax=Cannabis sativa TaxID=3483 RepID=A0A803PRX4_CANSA